jgi:hypothetical protein
MHVQRETRGVRMTTAPANQPITVANKLCSTRNSPLPGFITLARASERQKSPLQGQAAGHKLDNIFPPLKVTDASSTFDHSAPRS